MTMRWSAQEIQAREQAREEERRRLARELHDELGHALFGLRMHVVWLQQRLTQGDAAGSADIQERLPAMLELVERSSRTVDEIVADLRPPALDQLGLMAALEWQAESFSRRSGLRCQFAASGEVELDAGRATAVFRMFQEILTNVERHASASRVDVEVKRVGDRLVLRVRDNGKGLAPDRMRQPGSFGLLGMRERALLLGGELAVESGGRRGGTTVTATIPLANRRAQARVTEIRSRR